MSKAWIAVGIIAAVLWLLSKIDFWDNGGVS